MPSDLDRLVALQPDGARPPLFCVHAVSGSPYCYAALARELAADDQPVYGIEAPGFDNDRAPVRSLPTLADEYAAILQEVQPDGPFRLLGWSLGGLVAYEMAKRLAAAGTPAEALIMVDAGLPAVMSLPPERDILRRFVRDMMGLSDHEPPQVQALFARLPRDVAPARAFSAVVGAQILSAEMDAELLSEQYAVFRGLLEGYYSIHVTGPYEGPAVHILAERSPMEEMRWRALIPRLREHTILGSTHHSIWTGRHFATLTALVRRALAARQAEDVDDRGGPRVLDHV